MSSMLSVMCCEHGMVLRCHNLPGMTGVSTYTHDVYSDTFTQMFCKQFQDACEHN